MYVFSRAELDAWAARDQTVWQQTWQQYQELLLEDRRIERAKQLDSMPGGFDGQPDPVHGITQRCRRFEAAQAGAGAE